MTTPRGPGWTGGGDALARLKAVNTTMARTSSPGPALPSGSGGVPAAAAPVTAAKTGIAPGDFAFLAQYVQARSAIVLEPGKEYLVASRLSPVARAHGMSGVAEVAAALRARPSGPLGEQVIEAMTTNETSFFRDGHPFDALAALLPDLIRNRTASTGGSGGQVLQVWCAACSSGQEPYSVAMVLADALAGRAGWTSRVLCTDLSPAMLARTAEGAYSQLEVNRGLPAPRLIAHFVRAGARWQASAALRAMMDTRVMNLAVPFPPMPLMDVVFLRNVLIYFDAPTKQAILNRVAAVMRPGGLLFLGAAETTLSLNTPFERTTVGRTPVYRLTGKAPR